MTCAQVHEQIFTCKYQLLCICLEWDTVIVLS